MESMGKQITSQKGTQYTLTFAATEKNSSGNYVASNITGATITFSVYDSNVNLNLLFSVECTITDAANGLFEFFADHYPYETGWQFCLENHSGIRQREYSTLGQRVYLKIEDLG